MTEESNTESAPETQQGSGDLFNTAAGWVLFAAGLGLGLSIIADKYFHGYDNSAPETEGYPIAVAEVEGEKEMTFAEALTLVSAEDGEKVFRKCAACHTIDAGGANGVGPNLHGVMGAGFGNSAGFGNYSGGLTSAGGTWGWDEMNEWLDNPRGYIDGTTMGFNGLSSIEDRAAVALYLNANGSNLALPEFVAEEEAPAAEGEEGEGADLEAEATADETSEVEAEQNVAEATSEETAEAEAS